MTAGGKSRQHVAHEFKSSRGLRQSANIEASANGSYYKDASSEVIGRHRGSSKLAKKLLDHNQQESDSCNTSGRPRMRDSSIYDQQYIHQRQGSDNRHSHRRRVAADCSSVISATSAGCSVSNTARSDAPSYGSRGSYRFSQQTPPSDGIVKRGKSGSMGKTGKQGKSTAQQSNVVPSLGFGGPKMTPDLYGKQVSSNCFVTKVGFGH